jgi:hypothetical protein
MKSIVKGMLLLLVVLGGGCADISTTSVDPCGLGGVFVKAEPDSIGLGDSVVVSWNSHFVEWCVLSVGSGGVGDSIQSFSVELNGSRTFRPEVNTTFHVYGGAKGDHTGGCTSNYFAEVHIGSGRYYFQTEVEGMGRVMRTPDSAAYFRGSQVQLTAIPDSGYRFVRWSQTCPPGGDPWTLTYCEYSVDNPVTITLTNWGPFRAEFSRNP